ncbi:uncharacterized protein DEA37_0002882 [Paragonimus westermani]|uniref:Reverse transcriptase/retrotransposon-derived protein RNase H-like domain-containing protein n=1 Tax=Paragonimus westermani TaxID=34504 RepID=A0A5J4NN97_9TREM|nr:uncharacterized protein DEA37_0002882 [Paragonimus westermani]
MKIIERGEKFVWSPECHAAFNTLGDKLNSLSILASTNFSPTVGPCILDTDASDLAIGAVLSQKSANGEVMIAYASRLLDKRERRYCTTRREMITTLAVSIARAAVTRMLKLCPAPLWKLLMLLSTSPAGATWAHYQLNDPYIFNIYRRQLDGNPKPTGRQIEGNPPEERCLWPQWNNLRVIYGVLNLFGRTKGTYRLIFSPGKNSEVVRGARLEAGYAGKRTTEAAVRRPF